MSPISIFHLFQISCPFWVAVVYHYLRPVVFFESCEYIKLIPHNRVPACRWVSHMYGLLSDEPRLPVIVIQGCIHLDFDAPTPNFRATAKYNPITIGGSITAD